MGETLLFSASLDRYSFLTTFIAVILSLSAILVSVSILRHNEMSRWTRLLLTGSTTIPAVFFMAAAFFLAPRNYAIRNGVVSINRLAGPIEIPLSSIKSVGLIRQEDLTSAKRIMASGGLFGYFGAYDNPLLGRHKRYATQLRNAVLIKANESYVITPDLPEYFVESLEDNLRLKSERQLIQ